MSYLAIDQLENNIPVIQQIRLSRSTNIAAVRLNICKAGVLTDGVLTLELFEGLTLLGSASLTFAEINVVGVNFHGMIKLLPSNTVAIRKLPSSPYVEIDLKITMSSHANSDSAYVGLVKDPHSTIETYNDDNNPNTPTNPELDIWYYPFGIEIYSI